MHQRDCLAPPTSVQLEEGVGTGRTAVTQVGENEFSRIGTFPDESVPLASRERAPAEIADGVRRMPTRLGIGLRCGLSGGRAAEAAPPHLLCVDPQIQRHFAFTGP